MMVTRFLRVWSSPTVLLVLAMTATTLVQRADGTGPTSDDLTVACGAEIQACQEDETCTSCSAIPETNSADFQRCYQSTIADAAESSTVYCLGHMVGMCCLDDASENECLQNDPFVKYWMCALDVGGCWVDKIECSNGWMVGSSTSGVAAGIGDASIVSAVSVVST